jgi:hypothetical protein
MRFYDAYGFKGQNTWMDGLGNPALGSIQDPDIIVLDACCFFLLDIPDILRYSINNSCIFTGPNV